MKNVYFMKRLIFFLPVLFCCVLVNGQAPSHTSLSDTIGKRIKYELDYKALGKIDCNNSGLRFLMLSFEIDKNGYAGKITILNDSASILLPYLEHVLEKPFKLMFKFKEYKKRVFLQPIFYAYPYCEKKQNKLAEDHMSLTLSETELKTAFQFQLKSVIASLSDIFGNGSNVINIRNVVIFPSITIDGIFSSGKK